MGGNSWATDVSARTKKLMVKAGVPVIKFHEIRHFNPTSMLAADVHPKIVSQQLDHSSVKMTLDRYSHPNVEHQKQVSDAMETLMQGVNSKRKSS
jgi:integrase